MKITLEEYYHRCGRIDLLQLAEEAKKGPPPPPLPREKLDQATAMVEVPEPIDIDAIVDKVIRKIGEKLLA